MSASLAALSVCDGLLFQTSKAPPETADQPNKSVILSLEYRGQPDLLKYYNVATFINLINSASGLETEVPDCTLSLGIYSNPNLSKSPHK